MNQCHFLGNLVRDPEVRTTKGEKKVVNFVIAINRSFKKGNDWGQETAFLDCEAWDTGADLISRTFSKGDPIIVHGSLKQDNWEDRDGNSRSKLKLRVEKFQRVPGFKKKNETAAVANEDENFDDDVPY